MRHADGTRGRTGIIALGVPSLSEPYFAELASLLLERARAAGRSVLVCETESDRQREIDLVNGVGLPPVDGLVHVPRALTVPDLTRRAEPGPLVLIGEPVPGSPFSYVSVDNRAAAREATEHLIARGRTRIAMIGPRLDAVSVAADRRFAGYGDAVAAHDLAVDPGLIRPVHEFSPAEGRRVLLEAWADGVRPDAVVCSSDSVAIGVLTALAEVGAVAGRDVAVIGFDDIQQSAYLSPALSTVAPDKGELVDTVLRLLLDQITTPPAMDPPAAQVRVPHRLVVRESSGPAGS